MIASGDCDIPLAEACAEIRELRKQRDELHAHNNKALFARRLAKEAGEYCLAKWGRDYKKRGRKLLEESAELMVSLSDEWKLKQYGKISASNEIGDVQIVLWSIGELLGVDVNEAALRKFNEVREKHGPLEVQR